MADEITLGYYTGVINLTYGAYEPDGTVRTAAGTSLTEVAGTGYYKATDANVVAGDIVIVKEGTAVVAYGEYLPDVISSTVSAELAAIDTKVDTLDTNIDTLIVAQQTVHNTFPAETTEDSQPRIINL